MTSDLFATDALDEVPGDASPDHAASTSLWMLAAAVAALLFSCVMFADTSRGVQLGGWFLSAPVPFTLVALFRRRATARLVSAGIGMPRSAEVVAALILVAGFACSVLHALLIAKHYA
jgi:hypothetical protein